MKIFVMALLFLCLGCINAETNYGTGLKKVCSQDICSSQLDFNGDGISDTMTIFKTTENSKIDKSCQLVGLNKPDNLFEAGQQVVFGFKLSATGKTQFKKFMVFNHSYFSTPIWQIKTLPVTVIYKDSINSFAGSDVAESANGDILSLGTESGINNFLYWDGKKFALFEPNEEP